MVTCVVANLHLLIRCCEGTLQVLRDNEESLMTILQVLLYDPLYDWKISPLKAIKLQSARSTDSTGSHNTTLHNIFDDDVNPDGITELLL